MNIADNCQPILTSIHDNRGWSSKSSDKESLIKWAIEGIMGLTGNQVQGHLPLPLDRYTDIPICSTSFMLYFCTQYVITYAYLV